MAKRKTKERAGASAIMAGVRDLRKMLDDGAAPADRLTIRIAEVADPGVYSPAKVLAVRNAVGASQAKFAAMVGVSTVLVGSWENGVREPSPLARRMLDIVSADPAGFVAAVVRHSAGA